MSEFFFSRYCVSNNFSPALKCVEPIFYGIRGPGPFTLHKLGEFPWLVETKDESDSNSCMQLSSVFLLRTRGDNGL